MSAQTIERSDPGYVEVLAGTSAERDALLNDAEARLRHVAMGRRCGGILVTWHGSGRYSLALSEAVPFGQTWEHRLS